MNQIPLAVPHMSGNEQKYIQQAFDTNWIAPLGPNVDQFEANLATYTGAKDVAVTNSGTSAIHLALTLLNVQNGDTVFCSTFTFIASINPALYLGAKPVFIDSEMDTWGMSPIALAKALKDAAAKNKLPKAIIVVHLYGQSCKMDEIMALANRYSIPVIEDAAESLGSTYKGRQLGTIGTFGIYSFNGNKIITTSGGGALVSNDAKQIEKARYLASQAKEAAPYYSHSEVGFNYRLSNVLAGIGIAQLDVLDERIAKKRAIFDAYETTFKNNAALTFLSEWQETFNNRWLTTVLLEDILPEKIIEKLAEKGIESRRLWKPMHTQELFQDATYYSENKEGSNADILFQKGICLPSGTQMTHTQIALVCQVLGQICK
ncbi:pyridoxal phosphate-dependent aminotransferase [Listeria newyorkensis]|uniref:Pyridoxal phosphate-dependent aminotransferase n=2 Tax=Listeriaceae TaxID=186820 RepID=A0ABX4XNV1_9LIST|nr:pyridoxal phosphate-dependent aminotransferase [Listeria newyorkensis]KGL42411.1 pyridoxal phosphate-dependent aminotransferase [Listeriaceae bacterium FSL A5-0209]PNP92810.1 pyridoxal phosphate-dependent aminotransferase [Listeria newyorkensis]RQW66612.1 aminotransferase class I/II-fold pyridoxal phosphate-dependent enzyme [Listeria sp. SHR_NRA_18]SQC57151.1 UDP-4-amino-4-deoxy-L-arabinose--oxoglutarate aminotransferase [Listeria newyorkensis]